MVFYDFQDNLISIAPLLKLWEGSVPWFGTTFPRIPLSMQPGQLYAERDEAGGVICSVPVSNEMWRTPERCSQKPACFHWLQFVPSLSLVCQQCWPAVPPSSLPYTWLNTYQSNETQRWLLTEGFSPAALPCQPCPDTHPSYISLQALACYREASGDFTVLCLSFLKSYSSNSSSKQALAPAPICP